MHEVEATRPKHAGLVKRSQEGLDPGQTGLRIPYGQRAGAALGRRGTVAQYAFADLWGGGAFASFETASLYESPTS